VTMDCELCNQRYVFDRDDLGDVLAASDPPTLH